MQSLRLSLTLINLTVLRITGQALWRMFPNWDLSDVFLKSLVLYVLGKKTTENTNFIVEFQGYIRVLSTRPISVCVKLDHLARAVSVEFLHCIATAFVLLFCTLLFGGKSPTRNPHWRREDCGFTSVWADDQHFLEFFYFGNLSILFLLIHCLFNPLLPLRGGYFPILFPNRLLVMHQYVFDNVY